MSNAAGVGTIKGRNWRDFGSALLYMAPALILFILFTFAPFLRAIWLSFFIVDRNSFQPAAFYGLNYYGRIFNLGDAALGDDYLQSILTTIEFALMVVPLSLVAAMALADLATAPVRRIGAFRTMFSTSVAISVASASVIWSLIFSPNSRLFSWLMDIVKSQASGILTDSRTALPAVAFMTMWTSLGFNFIIAFAGLQAIPRDLREAAEIEGCGRWRYLWTILVPLARPSIATLAIYGFLNAWNQYYWPLLVIDSPVWRTAQVGITAFRSTEIASFNLQMAATIVVMLPTLVLLWAGQKQLIGGLTAGALKG